MSTLHARLMDEPGQATNDELVRVSLEMPRDVLAWIDGLNAQLGLQSRGATITRLLQEIRGEAEITAD